MNPPRPYVIKKIACVFMCHTGSRLFATVLQCCSFHTQWCRSIHGNPAESVFHCSHFCMQKNCISQVKKLFPVLHSSFFFFFFFFLLNHFFFLFLVLWISKELSLPKSSLCRISQQFNRDEQIIPGLANPVWAGDAGAAVGTPHSCAHHEKGKSLWKLWYYLCSGSEGHRRQESQVTL